VADEQVSLGQARGRWVLFAAVLGSGTALLDTTIVNVALPTLGRDLDAGFAGLQWVVNGYTLALAALILLGGSLGDRYGRRRLFVAGTVWFGVASVLCGLAPSVEALIVFRVLQGVGAALLTPGSLALLSASFVAGDRGRAIGAWSALTGVAAAVGPLVGGLLVELSWRLVFFVNVPLCAAVVLVALRHVPESRNPQSSGRLDLGGAALGALGLGLLTSALVASGEKGASATTVVVGAAGLLALVGFVVAERRAPSPMLPTGIFASRQFTAANVVTFAVYAALGGIFFLLVVHLQVVAGYSPFVAGTALLPVTGAMLLLSPRAGALAERTGPRLLMTAGPLVCSVGALLMLRIGRDASYAADVLPAVIVFGVGLSATVAPLTTTVLSAAPGRHAGVASGVNNAVARTAGLLAVAVLPLVGGISGDDYQQPSAFASGFSMAVLVAAGLLAAGGAVAAVTISDDEARRRRRPTERTAHCELSGPPLEHPSGARRPMS
jgi:EmrB/QacA subfamily drug resistance transporter